MNVRQTLILAVVFLLGVLTAGAFIGRPAAAEPKADVTVAGPKADAAAVGRYQIVPVTNHAAAGSIVVMDTATGECWSNDTNGRQDTWAALGVPSKTR